MPRRLFNIYQRNGIYHVRFWDESRRLYTNSRTTQSKNPKDAEHLAMLWLRDGFPEAKNAPKPKRAARGDLPFMVLAFWGYDSQYNSERRANGKSTSKNHCSIQRQIANKWVKPYFEGRTVASLKVNDFTQWRTQMEADGATPRSIADAFRVVKTCLNWLRDEELIVRNPMGDKKIVVPKSKAKRRTLTLAEGRKLFALAYPDPRVRLLVGLGALCGLRLSEARALKWADLRTLNDGWTIKHPRFLRAPRWPSRPRKDGSDREVPVEEPLVSWLKEWKQCSPASGDGDYILVDQRDVHIPASESLLRSGFYSALSAIGISDDAKAKKEGRAPAPESRQGRSITEHSLRHWYNTHARPLIADDTLLRATTGHKSASMTENYTDTRSSTSRRCGRRSGSWRDDVKKEVLAGRVPLM